MQDPGEGDIKDLLAQKGGSPWPNAGLSWYEGLSMVLKQELGGSKVTIGPDVRDYDEMIQHGRI